MRSTIEQLAPEDSNDTGCDKQLRDADHRIVGKFAAFERAAQRQFSATLTDPL
ncbi:MAG: hypothetical protein ABSE50_20205 [Xanthobacteraceae bacterium]